MKTEELRQLDDRQLKDQIKGYYEELFNLRFQQVTGRLTATSRARVVKREIARIKTILRERELAGE
ncbi:MAG: 50S ribosomal protein L29 [Roseiflexaceae bacterium]